MKQRPGRGVCGTLLASMENALAMEVTTDADDQAGHGESHEQNGDEGDGQDIEEKYLTSRHVMNTILFCFLPCLSLRSYLFFLLSLSWKSKRGFILFSLVSMRLPAFWS